MANKLFSKTAEEVRGIKIMKKYHNSKLDKHARAAKEAGMTYGQYMGVTDPRSRVDVEGVMKEINDRNAVAAAEKEAENAKAASMQLEKIKEV